MIRPAHSVLRLILISGKIYEASCLFFQSILASSFCFRQSTPPLPCSYCSSASPPASVFCFSASVLLSESKSRMCQSNSSHRTCLSSTIHRGVIELCFIFVKRCISDGLLLLGTLAAIIEREWGSLWLARTHDAPTRTDDLNFRAQRQGRDHGSARNRSKMGTLTNS